MIPAASTFAIPEITAWSFSATLPTLRKQGPSAVFNFPNFSQPQGIAVSTISREMWVTAGNTVYHLPEVTTFQNTSTILQQIAVDYADGDRFGRFRQSDCGGGD